MNGAKLIALLAVVWLVLCLPSISAGQCPCGCQPRGFSYQSQFQFDGPQVYEATFGFQGQPYYAPQFNNYVYSQPAYNRPYGGRQRVFFQGRPDFDFSAGFSTSGGRCANGRCGR